MHHRHPFRVARCAAFAVAVLMGAGCAAQPATDEVGAAAGTAASSSASVQQAAPSSAASSAVSSAAPPIEAVAVSSFPGDTSPDLADPVDPAGLTVTAVRAAAHDGYDRVVFELAGTGTPGWSVEYVDSPSAQGSGAVVDVPGSAFLRVALQGTSYPYETGAAEVGRGAVPAAGTEEVAGLFYDGTFEGSSVAWIGTGARTPFRVYALTGPSRVVVEVAHAG